MIYSEFKDKQLSLLGLGAMRLPCRSDGSIDEERVEEMIEYAIGHGLNYFDTAYPYHDGNSERVIGRILRKYPRESYYFATKYPGHQISSSYDPASIFEEQLQKCGLEYFDFYLLHNVYENSIDTYLDPKWGILDYFREQKKLGRIRHLGFSSHGRPDNLKDFLDICGDDMEFCQIQLNYLDWTLQDACAKYEMLTERGIPVWVMEPVRGGKLAKLSEEAEGRLNAVCPGASPAAWAFRFLQRLPNVKVVLSGMSDMQQLAENISTFETRRPLNDKETDLLLSVAEELKDSVPCTACRYCCKGCPLDLDIPMLLGIYNEVRFSPSFTAAMGLDALPEDKKPAACIGCGQCSMICPQKIDIPGAMKDFVNRLSEIPTWADICRQRDEASRK